MAQAAPVRSFVHNAAEPVRLVMHASLERISKESAYRVRCPVCRRGMLLVARHQQTQRLLRDDYCTHCAQAFRYIDEEINGESFADV